MSVSSTNSDSLVFSSLFITSSSMSNPAMLTQTVGTNFTPSITGSFRGQPLSNAGFNSSILLPTQRTTMNSSLSQAALLTTVPATTAIASLQTNIAIIIPIIQSYISKLSDNTSRRAINAIDGILLEAKVLVITYIKLLSSIQLTCFIGICCLSWIGTF